MGKKSKMAKYLLIAALAVFIALAASGTIRDSLFKFMSPQPCSIAPYSSSCTCEQDEERLATEGMNPKRYFCENTIKFIDLEDSQWKEKATEYINTKMTEMYPTCNVAKCDLQGFNWAIYSSMHESGRRDILAECEGLNTKPAIMQFKLVDGAVLRSACGDYTDPKDTNPSMTREQFKALCEGSANNEYCNSVNYADEYQCSTGEKVPLSSNIGVSYAYELVGDSWSGCGSFAKQKWNAINYCKYIIRGTEQSFCEGTVVCDVPYEPFYRIDALGTKKIQCQPDGTWSEISGKCNGNYDGVLQKGC